MLVKGACDIFFVSFPALCGMAGIADKTGKGRSDEGKLLLGHAQQVIRMGARGRPANR